MTDLNRLETALRNADAAGDTEAATKIAQAIRAARSGQPQGMSLYERADDDAKSIQSGVVGGVHELAGMFGSARDVSNRVVNWGAQKLGASPETAGQIANASQYLNPLTAFAPSSQQLKQATGFQPHQPKTAEGPYLQTTSEMAVGLMAGPGSWGNKLMSAPVVGTATEGAGQFAHTFAPQYEPQVRAATAIITSLLTGKPNIKEMTTKQLKDVKDEAYRVAKANGEVIAPEIFDQILNRVGDVAYEAGARPHLADQSIAALKYADEYSGRPIPVGELDDVRQLIKAPSEGLPSRDAHVSRAMTGEFDKAVDDLATDTHGVARKAYRDYKNSQLVDRLNHKIDLRASQYTLSGKENATRAVYRLLADNESKTRYMDKATKDAIDKVAMGGPVENAARWGGKFAPTGTIPVLTALSTGRVDLAVAMMGPGMVSRLAANYLTGKNRRLAEALIKRGGEDGYKSFKDAERNRLAQALSRALISSETSQGAGSR